MSEVRPTYDDEIDLFELFETLWIGKWLITAFVGGAMALALAYIAIKEPVYESKLVYAVQTLPPFYGQGKAAADFQNMFYSERFFDEWKAANDSTSLVFADFDATDIVDGFVLSRKEEEQLAVVTRQKDDAFVLVRSNQLPVLDDFFKYVNYVNDVLTNDYVSRASDELGIIEARFNDLTSAESSIVETVLSIDRYTASAKTGAKVFSVQRPTLPKKVEPKSSLVLALSIVLGGFIGCAYVLLRKAIGARRGVAA